MTQGNGITTSFSEEFEQLYYENQAKVYQLAHGLTGNANDAEEITQEAFYRALRSFGTFRKDSSFFTWIYRITLNVANNYLKQRKKMPVQALIEDLGYSMENMMDENPANNPEMLLLAKEARFKCLHCIIECLPIEQRKIFCLAITIGLPYKLVAEILGCSLSKVKTTLHRAKKRWFGYMENRCELIKKTNPCHCIQWVRFGLEQGWISRDEVKNPRPEINLQAIKEIKELKTMREIYTVLYPENTDQSLARRIKEGIQKKEWAIIS